jgi:hypothetical protein
MGFLDTGDAGEAEHVHQGIRIVRRNTLSCPYLPIQVQ